MSSEDLLQERCVEHRKRATRKDGKKNFGWLKDIVHAEFPNTRSDPFAFQKELGRVKRCLSRADGAGGNDSKTKKQMTVRRLRHVKKSQLRRRGDPGKNDYAPELHQAVFSFVVDTIQNVHGRINSDILKVHIAMYLQDLQRHYENEVENGRLDRAAIPCMPKLGNEKAMMSWIYRFRKKHHLAWNAVNLRLKCSLPKTYARVNAIFSTIFT